MERAAKGMMVVAALLQGGAAPVLGAAKGGGVSAASVLQVQIDAKAMGMGGAYSMLSRDAYALQHNVAALSLTRHLELTGTLLSGLFDTNLNFLGYSMPLPFSGVFRHGYAAMAAGLTFANNGNIEFNKLNSDGSLASSQNIDAGGDLVAQLGYSERLAFHGLTLRGTELEVEHFAGLGVKYLRSELALGFSASGVALDAGYLVKLSPWNFSAGLALRFGFALGLPSIWGHHFVLSADQDYLWHEREIFPSFGTSYHYKDRLILRVGYRFRREVEGFSGGFGLRHKGISFDYALDFNSEADRAHRLSFSWKFPGRSSKKHEGSYRRKLRDFPRKIRTRDLEKRDSPSRRLRRDEGERSKDIGVPGWIY